MTPDSDVFLVSNVPGAEEHVLLLESDGRFKVELSLCVEGLPEGRILDVSGVRLLGFAVLDNV